MENPLKWKTKTKWIVGGVIVLILTLILALPSPQAIKARIYLNQRNALVETFMEGAKNEISPLLKAPSTAIFTESFLQQSSYLGSTSNTAFCGDWEIPFELKPETRYYRLALTTDAQNGYGAMIRDTWQCDIEYRNKEIKEISCADLETKAMVEGILCY